MDRAHYFQEKQEKQLNQALKPVTNLFKDCIFYINGFTKPWSRIKLIQNIQLNGGRVKPFLSGVVTHILSQQWNHRWVNKVVIDSTWVIDCIEQKKLLPILNYNLKPLEINQNLITDNFTKLRSHDLIATEVENNEINSNGKRGIIISQMHTPQPLPNAKIRDPAFSSDSVNSSKNSNFPENENALTLKGNLKEIQSEQGNCNKDTNNYNSVYTGNNSNNSNDKKNKIIVDNTYNGPVIKNNDNLNCNAPNFVLNYLNHSRLHLISNWKQTLRDNFVNDLQDGNIKIPKDVITNKEDYVFVYMDFDCFFVNVSYTNYLKQHTNSHVNIDKDPIVVCHGNHNSDIASCNYVARKYGIKNGMWAAHAKKLLPKQTKLTILPYVFQDYKSVSSRLYAILNDKFEDWFDKFIVPMSIDECFTILKRSKFENNYEKLLELCQLIKQKVLESTNGCPMSIGIGNSFINAKLSLRLAKPKGIHFWNQDILSKDMVWQNLKIDDLPGLGHASLNKLPSNLKTLTDLSKLSVVQLKKYLGDKLGEKINKQLSGIDDLETNKMLTDPIAYFQRKSISIEINYAIRFQSITQIDTFIDRLTEYLLDKLDSKTLLKQVSLKIMKRHIDQPLEPIKFMGMGICQPLNNIANLPLPTRDMGIIATELKNLFRKISVRPMDVRGVGIQFNKLSKIKNGNQGLAKDFFLEQRNPTLTTTTNALPNKNNTNIGLFKTNKRLSPLKKSKFYNPQFSESSNTFHNFQSTYQQEFINELPTQIQREISNQIRIERKAKQTKLEDLKKKIEKRNLPQDVSHFMHNESIFQPINFQKVTNFKTISDMIDNWVKITMNDSTGPHTDDVRLFEKYLLKLANANKKHLVLRISNIISNRINLSSHSIIDGGLTQSGLQEWDRILLKIIIPILKQDNHTLQIKRSLDVEYDV